jgi:hypothetical protein
MAVKFFFKLNVECRTHVHFTIHAILGKIMEEAINFIIIVQQENKSRNKSDMALNMYGY